MNDNMSKIKKDILEGNGSHIRVADMLRDHIRDQHEYQLSQEKRHQEIMDKFNKGSVKIATNRTSIFFLRIISLGSYGYTSIVIGFIYFLFN